MVSLHPLVPFHPQEQRREWLDRWASAALDHNAKMKKDNLTGKPQRKAKASNLIMYLQERGELQRENAMQFFTFIHSPNNY